MGRSPITFGTTEAPRQPQSLARSARSASQDVQEPADVVNRKDAEGEKTWMSPVQPRRSSRCGQSVGRSRKLPRMLQTTFSCSRLISGSEHSNQPVRAISEWQTTARTSVWPQLARPAVDLRIAEAVEGEARLPGFFPSAAQDIVVGSPGCAQRADAQLAVFQHLGMAQGDGLSRRAPHRSGAGGRPGSGQNRAWYFPEGEVDNGDRLVSSIRRTGGPNRRNQGGEVALDRPERRPSPRPDSPAADQPGCSRRAS